MQDHVRAAGHTFSVQLTSCRAEQRQEFRCASTNVLMRHSCRYALLVPRLTNLRHRLVRTRFLAPHQHLTGLGRFVFAQHHQTHRFALRVGRFDQVFFASQSGSVTTTDPCLRLRTAVPVSHQVRLRCQDNPASCSTARIKKRSRP